MKIGFNSVLFGEFEIEKSFIAAKEIGYSGIELSALDPAMGQHIHESLKVSENIEIINKLSIKYDIPVTAIERAKHDISSWEYIVQVAEGIGCPIVNIGPGGKYDENGIPISEGAFDSALDSLKKHSEISNKYNVTTCFKAHYNTCIDNTELCIKAIKELDGYQIGLDFDPSHIFRVPENTFNALKQVIPWIKHIHIRDCVAPDIQGPGSPLEQICGRGQIDLEKIMKLLSDNSYKGPINLEVIGSKRNGLSIETCTIIAAESKGWLNNILSRL